MKITPGLFRFLLALLVVIHHSVNFVIIGHTAVYIFFILSGYWIAKMYTEKYSLLKSPYTTYLSSRLRRLIPVYILILSLAFFAAILYKSLLSSEYIYNLNFLLSNIFVLNLSNAEYALILPAWSLDIELQFYVLAPALLMLFSKYNNKMLVIIISIISVVYGFTIGYEFSCILNYVVFFAIGMYIYLSNWMVTSQKANVFVALSFCIYILQFSVPQLRDIFLHHRGAVIYGMDYRLAINVIIALLFIPFVSINVRANDNEPGKLFSSMSYVIYLIHWPILIVYSQISKGAHGIEKSIYWFLYLGISIFSSYIISKYYDAYFESMRRKYVKSKSL